MQLEVLDDADFSRHVVPRRRDWAAPMLSMLWSFELAVMDGMQQRGRIESCSCTSLPSLLDKATAKLTEHITIAISRQRSHVGERHMWTAE